MSDIGYMEFFIALIIGAGWGAIAAALCFNEFRRDLWGWIKRPLRPAGPHNSSTLSVLLGLGLGSDEKADGPYVHTIRPNDSPKEVHWFPDTEDDEDEDTSEGVEEGHRSLPYFTFDNKPGEPGPLRVTIDRELLAIRDSYIDRTPVGEHLAEMEKQVGLYGLRVKERTDLSPDDSKDFWTEETARRALIPDVDLRVVFEDIDAHCRAQAWLLMRAAGESKLRDVEP